MKFWMVWRYLQDGRKYLGATFLLAVLGVTLGVASLIIAMAVVSGYESTLRNSVINMQGHLMVTNPAGIQDNDTSAVEIIQNSLPELVALSPFIQVEGLLVHNKKLSGVSLEGVNPETIGYVVDINKRLLQGKVDLQENQDSPHALVGKGLAKKFGIKVGDEFKVVRPYVKSNLESGFKTKIQKFKATGIIDLGRSDFDERFILSSMKGVQAFGDLGNLISGWRLKLTDYQLADVAATKLEDALGGTFSARPWSSANRNLFQAVKYEKAVIFVVVLLMVVAAAFNVASTLFLNVVRRYPQISILKTLGVKRGFVRKLFTLQGMIIGGVGAFLGVVLGWLGCRLFLWAEIEWGLFPGEVYKLDFVELEIRTLDLTATVLSTLIICYLATLAPAIKGARLPPVEGLRYE